MRRLISLALTALMIISMFTVGVFTTTASAADDKAEVGSVPAGYTPEGTPINTAAELAAIEGDGKYYLNADITVTETNDNDFTGTLDGNGKTVTVQVPIFENLYTGGTIIKNMIIKGEISYRKSRTEWHCGTIAMEGNELTLDNIANYANVFGFETAKTIYETNPVTGEETVSYDSIYSGGLLGSVYGNTTITNCENYGEVNALVAGGLVGSIKKVPKAEEDDEGEWKKKEITVLFENCHNFGYVSDDNCHDLIVTDDTGAQVNKKQGLAGGLISYMLATNVTFRNCTNTADIMSTQTGQDSGPGTVLNSSGKRDHTKEHTGSGVSGGIAGRILQNSKQYPCNVVFENCINEGDVTGWSQIGGIGGWINCEVECYNCTNTGTIFSRGNYAAGIIGRPGTDIENSGQINKFYDCLNTGEVIGHRQYAGGITSYSRDRAEFVRCMNSGYLHAEGLDITNPESTSKDDHIVQCAGIVVNLTYTANIEHCVNTGNMVSNYRCGGIGGAAGSEECNKYGGGLHNVYGCLNIGNLVTLARNNGDVLTEDILYMNDKGEEAIRYYYTPYGSAGIQGYVWGSGRSLAPNIFGCGSMGNVTVDFGLASGFLGYANTGYAMIQCNFFTGTLTAPDSTPIPHNSDHTKTDWHLTYVIGWFDRVAGSSNYLADNYCYEECAAKYMLYQENCSEKNFDGYEYYMTKDELESGALCYKLNKALEDWGWTESYGPLFFQDLTGKDGKYPTSPYFYITLNDDGSIASIGNYVVKDGDALKNENYVPGETTEETETDPPEESETDPPVETTEAPKTEETTKAPEETTKAPEATKAPETTAAPKASGGCGGVIGASALMILLAIIAPAGIMLKKKED